MNTFLSVQPATVDVSDDLCTRFLNFFCSKIANVRASISPSPQASIACVSPKFSCDHFEPISLPSLIDLVTGLNPDGSPNDLMPPRLLKEVFSVVGCPVLNIINASLTTGAVPQAFKQEVVQPVLKKVGLDATSLENFRPISKRPFLSKLLENAVFTQLSGSLHNFNILDPLQSGFLTGHRTESALSR